MTVLDSDAVTVNVDDALTDTLPLTVTLLLPDGVAAYDELGVGL